MSVVERLAMTEMSNRLLRGACLERNRKARKDSNLIIRAFFFMGIINYALGIMTGHKTFFLVKVYHSAV